MNQLVVFDVDGTLLTDSCRLRRLSIEGIKELKKRNIPYTLATGRSFSFCHSLAKKIGVEIPLITCNGALIHDPHTGKVIDQKILPENDAREILKELAFIDANIYLTTTQSLFLPISNRRIPKIRPSMPIEKINSLLDYPGNDLVKITIEGFDYHLILNLANYLLKRFDSIVNITLSDDVSIDITAHKSNKGEAVKSLASELDSGIVYAFGNHHNDIEMLRFATIGIAMGNSLEPVKQASNFVTLSNNDDGIMYALKQKVF